MNDSRLRPLWSEEELDAALAALHADPETVPSGSDANADIELGLPVVTPAPAHHRRRWAYPTVAAGVAAALAAGGIAVGYAHRTAPTPRTSAAASASPSPTPSLDTAGLLNQLADRAAATPDPVVGPGQYLYVDTTTVGATGTAASNTAAHPVQRQSTRFQTWIPADTSGTWHLTTTISTASLQTGALVGQPQVFSESARCGDFVGEQTGRPIDCGRDDRTQQVTPPVVAKIPRDPAQLLRWLRAKNPTSPGDVAAAYLQSAIVPNELRAALYRALALQPGLGSAGTVTLNGQRGVALPAGPGDDQDDVVMNPDTGGYLGLVSQTYAATGEVRPGDFLAFATTTVKVVDRSGATS